jgi:hypothetical protein
MIIQTTTDQIDLICLISITLKCRPSAYSEDSVEYHTEKGILSIDFEGSEIQFLDFETSDEIYFQILGIAHTFGFTTEDYTGMLEVVKD